MTKATTQTINTQLISTPTFTVSNKLTALHLASMAWDLYCEAAPTNFAGEFTICEGGDFSMYNIGDCMDMSQHYYDCAFGIGNNVRDDITYSVQDAYNMLEDIGADTVVREEVSSTVYNTVSSYSEDAVEDGYIADDYAHLCEETSQGLPQRIAQLETQLAKLKATAAA